MLRNRIIERSQVNAYLTRKEKSEQDILATEDANQPLPCHIKLVHLGNPSLNIHPYGQQLDMSPLTLTTPSLTATYTGAFSDQSSRQSTPASNHEPVVGHGSSVDLRRQEELPGFDLQESLDRLNVGNPQKLPSSNSSSLDVPSQPINIREGFDTPAAWSFIDAIESYNSVINDILSPDPSAGTEPSQPSQPSQLSFFKILSGARRVSNPEELIRGLDRQFCFPMGAMKDIYSQQHSPNLTQRFLGCFFDGCMLQRQGASEGAINCFRFAHELLRDMIENCHPECLSALNGMLPVLEAHGQSQLAGEFLSNVLALSKALYNNPVAATAEFIIGVATRRLKCVAVEIKHLEDIHRHLKDRFGDKSPSALVGLYHIAWRCAKEEQHRDRALQILTELVPLTSGVMGPSHFLTITGMTTRARVLSSVHSKQESILQVYQTIRIIDQRYAPFHPYRLEVLHRLAILLIETHHAKEAENILRGVIEQRVVVLGSDNSLTDRSVKLLQEAIRATGRHVELDELKSQLLPPKVSEMFLDAPSTAFLPLL